MLRLIVAAAGVAAFLVPGDGKNAVAAEQNRAVLVVDTGERVKRICVRFWEEAISGAELLRRAEVDAALRPYAGKGVAVCSICGVGCRTDDSCLTCDPDGRYWAYSRAPAGTATFRLSPAGASNTEVRNGDVEGWRWSRGTSPGYISVEEVCDGAAPATSAVDTTAPASTSTTVAQPPAATDAPAGSSGPPLTSLMPPTSRPSGSASAGTGPLSRLPSAGAGASPADLPLPHAVESSPASSPDAAKGQVSSPGSDVPAANRRPADDGRGGSPAGLLVFAGVLAGLLGWAAWARRRRRLR